MDTVVHNGCSVLSEDVGGSEDGGSQYSYDCSHRCRRCRCRRWWGRVDRGRRRVSSSETKQPTSSLSMSSANIKKLNNDLRRVFGKDPAACTKLLSNAKVRRRRRASQRVTTNARRTARPRRSWSACSTRRPPETGPCHGPYAPAFSFVPIPKSNRLTTFPQAKSSKSAPSTPYAHETSPPLTASSPNSRPITQTTPPSSRPRRASTHSRDSTSSASSHKTASPTSTPPSRASPPTSSRITHISATPSIWSGG